jgi:uncharacterized membrane protein YbjE (DUF340 family)
MSMYIIIVFLLAGFLTAYFRFLPDRFYKLSELSTSIGLIVLLAAMGARIGVDDRILTQIRSIGFKSLLLAVGSISGSIIFVKLYTLWTKKDLQFQVEDKKLNPDIKEKNLSVRIFLSVIIGVLSGIFLLPPSFFLYLDSITSIALAVLLFGVGIDIGNNKEIFSQLKVVGLYIILIPFLVAIGSILGSVLFGLLIGMARNEAAAVGAGFGWYSLSGILLSMIHSVELGSIAFLANVFRELLTILILPFLVKHLGVLSCIAPGGATTMDVTLPVIRKVAGEKVLIPAFINGVILSILVPILVPFMLNL